MQEIYNIKINNFLHLMKNDIKDVKFSKTKNNIKLSIGKFSISRKIGNDYEYDVKKLFEDFMTNTSIYYIKTFWRQ